MARRIADVVPGECSATDPHMRIETDGIRRNALPHRLCRHVRAVEGMTGIEPAPSVWKTEALPLSYIPVRPLTGTDQS